MAAVAALDRNRAIGKDNRLPWDLPDDRAHYRALIWGKPLIMGRTTFELIRNRAENPCIVLTRDHDYRPNTGAVTQTPEEALRIARQEAERLGVDEIIVNGGAQIYSLFLPYTDRLYLTEINGEFEGDAFFPELDRSEWTEVERTQHPTDDRHAYAFDFVTYDRVKQSA